MYPKKYCNIVADSTKPTCFESSIAELWVKDVYSSSESWSAIHNLNQEDIITAINTQNFSEIFLFDKDFTAYLGGITRNSSDHIIGAKATIIQFFGKIDIDAITEEDKRSISLTPVSIGLRF